ncbi:LTA synthase family protein [Candidatus Clostridium radicumherbarum]|uniref:LTA synthase family protein n=1 Tax=Candidatus Clostridium radicumherbarum TaxID=3381662 RepID=A0ABW8TVM0_9CLOT
MKKAKNILINNLDIILFFITLTIKVLLYGRHIQENYFKYQTIIIPIASSVLILISFLLLFKKRSRIKAILILDIFISLILICDINYFRYFKDIPTISVLRNGLMLGTVKSSVASLFKLSDLLYIADIILFFVIKELNLGKGFNETKLRLRLCSFVILLIAGGAINSIYIYKLSVEQPRLITTMFNRIYIATDLGILDAHGIDIYNQFSNTIDRHSALPQEKETAIKTFIESNSTVQTNKLSGTAKGKNLIMIQVEALQQFVINQKIEGQEITPNLNKWIKKSAYFNNFFYQISSGGTSDAEFMTNNSLYPSSSGAAYYMYAGNEFNSLGTSFKAEGYSTAALHGFKSTFWNRNVMYNAEGFDNFYSDKDYNIDSKVGLGLSDESFLRQSVDKLKAMQSPYYAFLITLSSHFPFDDQAGYGDFNVGKYNNTLIGNYIRGIHYTDKALGDFLDTLDKEGILKDSIVVLYGDHNAIPKENEQELADFMNIKDMNDLQWSMLQKVPMMIHFPEDKNAGTYNKFAGDMDVYPTLKNLFSLKSGDTLGKDLFNSKDETVIFRNGSFTDGNIYYYSPTNTYYNIKTGAPSAEDDNLKAKKDNAQMQLEYSDDILKHNLIKKYKDSIN